MEAHALRPLHARVSAVALRHNLAVVRQHAPASKIMVVLKADAYGHGLVRSAAALQDADGFALLELQSALALRKAGHCQRILLLEGLFRAAHLALAARHAVDLVVHHDEQIDMLLRPPPQIGKIDVFLKINTGLNRLGFPPSRLKEVLDELRHSAVVGRIVLMTHFACADTADGIRDPLSCFDRAAQGLGLPASLAASAAILRHPASHRDYVRPGIMVYGASPLVEQDGVSLGLRPAMTLASRIIAVQSLRAGDSVGYGAAFQATGDMRIGVVACGYGDGYPRQAPTGTPVLVAGVRTRLLGVMSMDMLCVDLTGLDQVGVGSETILWGAGLPVEEVALKSNTIANELLCSVAARVPRVYD